MVKKIRLGGIKEVPAVAVGCMRLANASASAEKFIGSAVDSGLNFFDHADIYGRGECERVFSKAVKSLKIPRDKLIIQSKCGIVPGRMYDFSAEHIVSSVNGILERLGTDYLDVLLLHRPDALMEPAEVREAFSALERAGKVKMFGVSNMNAMQAELLQAGISQKIAANQLQFSPVHASMISFGIETNMNTEGAADRSGGVLEYCRLKNITVQAWSPFQYGFIEGTYIDDPNFAPLNKALEEAGEKYGLDKTGMVAAWIARHPAEIQLVSGTMNVKRLGSICRGVSCKISREDWYKIYLAAGHILP